MIAKQTQKIIWARLAPELSDDFLETFGRELGEALAALVGVEDARVGVPRDHVEGGAHTMIAVIRFANQFAQRECESGEEYQRWIGSELQRHALDIQVWQFDVT